MTEVHMLPDVAEALDDAGPDLAATMASRICHDIASPLGAIANGVELLLLSGAERTPELDLIAQSVDGANARLRFFRIAFGAANGRVVGQREIVGLLRGLEKTSRYTYDWTPPGDHPREEVKAVFLLIQCIESALPMGGRLRVAREGSAWSIEAEGPRLRINPPVWDALGPLRAAPPETSALVQFALLPTVLDGLGRSLDLSLGPDRIAARF
jgi:histidine phosphotransferase ChpT